MCACLLAILKIKVWKNCTFLAQLGRAIQDITKPTETNCRIERSFGILQINSNCFHYWCYLIISNSILILFLLRYLYTEVTIITTSVQSLQNFHCFLAYKSRSLFGGKKLPVLDILNWYHFYLYHYMIVTKFWKAFTGTSFKVYFKTRSPHNFNTTAIANSSLTSDVTIN